MSVLPNPRHEAFAQAIFAGLVQPNLYSTHGAAYAAVGYTSNGVGKAGGTAEANASRLLKKAKIFDRVQELQQEHYKRVNKKIDLSKERVGRRLDLASQIAEQERNPQGIVASELGIAKVFHRIDDKDTNQIDFQTANSMQDIGKRLLQSVGLSEPDSLSIAAAIEANDVFIARLEAIRDGAQGLTIDQDD
jgi:tetrahydromethanopterin S-methyltransferase subunit G